MKHVFLIHSHTLFLTAMGVLDFLKIDKEAVVFLYSRHYSNSLIEPGCKTVEVTDLADRQEQLLDNRKRKGLLDEIDKLIDHVAGSSFVLYAPHFAMVFAQALYTHKKCVKAAYIQEGGMIYRKSITTHLSFRQKLRCFVADKLYRHTNRIWRAYGWYMPVKLNKQRDLDSYAISDEYFKYLPSTNHIIRWPHVDMPLAIKDNAHVFVFDGFVKNGLVEQEFYLDKCKKLVDKFAQPFNYIKFHPAQSQEECDTIKSYFDRQGRKYEVLDNSIPLEIVLASTSGLSVIGFGSSLLYFARDLGHIVHCMDRWLHGSPLYMQYKVRYGLDDF